MMTKRLYYSDSWRKAFTAQVTGLKRDEKGTWLCLDQTVFYPEGGGQPADTGLLFYDGKQAAVKDVQADEDGLIWHLTEPQKDKLPGVGDTVTGEIDWERRYDHMQQHTGEHILANSLFELTGGFTHGLYIGQKDASIDVSLKDGKTHLNPEVLSQIEELANRHVRKDGAIVCRFPEPAELETLPLRKAPAVTQNIRVCDIGGFEMVACGGTHLSRASQVGLIKILSAQPARGKLRLFFLCGQRAVDHYRKIYTAISRSSALLSSKEEEVPDRVADLQKQLHNTKSELAALRRKNTLARVPDLLSDAQSLPDGRRLIVCELEETALADMEALAGALVKESRVLTLLCVKKDGRHNLLFARSMDLDTNMSELIKATGAKGGGRPEFARGASDDALPWEAAKVMAPRF